MVGPEGYRVVGVGPEGCQVKWNGPSVKKAPGYDGHEDSEAIYTELSIDIFTDLLIGPLHPPPMYWVKRCCRCACE